jgi:hypothetical protein
MTRRTLLRRSLAGAATLGMGRAVHGAAPTTGGTLVERQPTGAEIWQVTKADRNPSNIYCEVPYCSRDSRYFVYARTNPDSKVNRTEFMVVELGTWKQHRLDTATSLSGCAMSSDGLFYYVKRAAAGDAVLLCADLAAGTLTEVYEFQNGLTIRSLGTVTTERRYYAGGTMTEPGWKVFDVALVDLKKGTQTILDRDPFILNAHPQFEPGKGHTLMIQHNRGGTYTTDGKLQHLVGPQGATLYLLSVPGGQRTELQVGKPFTTPCTGHEAWIGASEEILLSVSASGDFAPEKGSLLGVRAGQPPRVVGRGYRFNHVGVSRCGRLFCCDDWRPPYRIVIGSTRSGKSAVVCASKAQPSRSQNSHPHAYLTPDLKWVIFNSNRSGPTHIYAARVAEDMTQSLLS